MDASLQRAVTAWMRARERISSCVQALDSMLDAHPELAPLQLELQVLRGEMLELAEQLTVVAATMSAR